jgi:putative spermidine/putrescine transport system permease protein
MVQQISNGIKSSALFSVTFAVLVFLALPNIVVVLISFNEMPSLAFPPTNFSLKWYANILNVPSFASGLRLSIILAVVSSFASLILGVLVGLAIVRFRFPGRQAINALAMSPLFVPEVVMGVAMLLWASILPFVSSLSALIVLHCLIVLPYMVRLIIANLQTIDPNLESAAMLLGARPATAFMRITFPLLGKGLLGATVFAVVMSFHNFTATMFLVGNNPTLTVAAYQYIRTENDPTVAALSTMTMLGAILAVYLLNRWIGLERLVR